MRKIFACGLLVLLMLLSACCGYMLKAPTQSDAVITSAVAPQDKIGAFRTERQQIRQMQLSQLNEIIHSDSPDDELVALAQRRQLELMEWSEQETTLEGVLSLRGFDSPVVTVHQDSVNVLLSAESVSRQESAVILELVTRETGISVGNVKIIPIN